jgi:hypothetical protein
MEKLLNVRSDKFEKKPVSKFDLVKPRNDDLSNLVDSVKRKSKNASLQASKKMKT